MSDTSSWHGTTILCVRKGTTWSSPATARSPSAIPSSRQRAQGPAHRRRQRHRRVCGRTADAFTLFERLEAKLEQYPGQLTRACVELAKDWRTDRYLRRLEAMMAVADEVVRWF